MIDARIIPVLVLLAAVFAAAPGDSDAHAGSILREVSGPSALAVVHRPAGPDFEGALRRQDEVVTATPDVGRVWRATVDALPGGADVSVLEAVNTAFNRLRYRRDAAGDEWSAPATFLARGAGDCEDYALAKYRALRDKGWPAEALAILVYVDRRIGAHAVLLAELAGDVWVLDNRHDGVRKADRSAFGRPLYLVNEQGRRILVPSSGAVASAMR